MPLILAFLRPYLLKIALFGAAVLGVLSILYSARQSGRAAERVDNLKKALANENERKQVDVDLARGGAVERERVRNAFSRD